MPLYQTLKPLFLASVAAVAVVTAISGAQRVFPTNAWAVVSVAAWIWVLTLATGIVFVLPVLAIAPRLRRPPIWLAAGWGAFTACAFVSLIFGRPYKLYGPQALVVFAAAGAVAGVCYAVLARRQPGAMG
jgi:hypothetical protein